MKLLLAACSLAGAVAGSAAVAEDGVKIGVLTCRMDGIENIVVYTKEEFACTFVPASGDAQNYTGVIKQVGVNLSVTKENELVWAVLAPSGDMVAPDILRGKYVGASTQVELVGGASANVLIGGGKHSITLQPVSVSGMIGAGAALDLTEFELS